MTPDEKRLVREMHFDRLMKPADIARTVDRDLSCVVHLLKQTRAPNPVGRPAALSETQVDKAVKVVDLMVDKADACSEVTVAMLLRRCRFKCCERVLSNALHSRGYYFHTPRKKMILTPDDVAARFAWATKYNNKTAKLCSALILNASHLSANSQSTHSQHTVNTQSTHSQHTVNTWKNVENRAYVCCRRSEVVNYRFWVEPLCE